MKLQFGRFYFFVSVLFISYSCNNSSTHNDVIIDSVKSNNHLKVQIDTIYKEYISLVPFDNIFSFGMTLSSWNKAIALQAKNRKYEKIDQEGHLSSYQAYEKINGDESMRLIKGRFISFSQSGNQYKVIKIGNVIQEEPILCEIEYECSFTDPIYINSAVDDLISKMNLSFVTGNNPIQINYSSPEVSRITLVDKMKKIVHDNDLSFKKTEEDIQSNSVSLFENDIFYIVVYISENKFCEVTRGEDAKVLSIKTNSISAKLRYRVCSKRFCDLNKKEYMTDVQKNQESEKEEDIRKTKALIEKALN